MSPVFIAAVVDMLLPGDSGGADGEPALPPASSTEIDLISIAKSYGAVFHAIANRAGGADAFATAAESARVVAIQSVERTMPDTFRALMSVLLANYYESAAVLKGMRWRADPPQPQGYQIQTPDAATTERLSQVRSRRKLWRE